MNSAWSKVFAKPVVKPVKPVVTVEPCKPHMATPKTFGKKTVRYMLDVPFSERDDAKELGARWNPNTCGYMIFSFNPHCNECVDRWNGYEWYSRRMNR